MREEGEGKREGGGGREIVEDAHIHPHTTTYLFVLNLFPFPFACCLTKRNPCFPPCVLGVWCCVVYYLRIIHVNIDLVLG